MRIIIIRHAEPNYESGHLTPRGVIEAEALSERLVKEKIDYVYISSFLRAIETAEPYLKKTNKEKVIYEWLHEFPNTVKDKFNNDEYRRPWDFQVEYFTSLKHAYDPSLYMSEEPFNDPKFVDYYTNMMSEFDNLLEKHGYKRENKYYRVTKSNHDTIAIFCHLGTECALLSRLMNLPYPALAQHLSPICSSVTEIFSEERKPGIAQFRVSFIGDYSHLRENGIEPSFAARFRECEFDDTRYLD